MNSASGSLLTGFLGFFPYFWLVLKSVENVLYAEEAGFNSSLGAIEKAFNAVISGGADWFRNRIRSKLFWLSGISMPGLFEGLYPTFVPGDCPSGDITLEGCTNFTCGVLKVTAFTLKTPFFSEFDPWGVLQMVTKWNQVKPNDLHDTDNEGRPSDDTE